MKSIHPKILLAACTLTFAACGSAPTRVSTSQLRSTMGLDPKDVAEVAAGMSESLLSANILRNKGGDGRSTIAILPFRNNTSLYDFDQNLVFNRVRVTLNKSGVAYCYVDNDSNVARGRAQVDASNAHTEQQNQLNEFVGSSARGKTQSKPTAQYSLTLELIEQHDKVGRTAQKSYNIHMTLNNCQAGSNTLGLAVWEDEQYINKMGTRPGVGF